MACRQQTNHANQAARSAGGAPIQSASEGTTIVIPIPDHFFEYARPQITDFLDKKGGGLMYKVGGEFAYELAANDFFGGSDPDDQWLIVSLLSPYVTGEHGLDLDGLELLEADLDSRTVRIYKKKSCPTCHCYIDSSGEGHAAGCSDRGGTSFVN